MNLKVSTRIFGGFLVVLGLAIIIILTAIVSIASINESIEDVTEKSMPMQTTGAKLVKTMLEGDVALFKVFNAASGDALAKSEEQFNKYKVSNLQAQESLKALVVDQPAMEEQLQKTIASTNAFFESSSQVIELRKKALELQVVVSELSTEFADMADEMISFSYDLEGMARSGGTQALITALTEDLENTVSVANASLSTEIKFEVLSNRGIIEGSLQGMESKLNQLSGDPELSGSEELSAMQDVMVRFKESLVGSNNVQQAKIDKLEISSQAKASLKTAQDTGVLTQKELDAFSALVNVYTEEIKADASGIVVQAQSIIVVLAIIVVALSLGISFWVTRSIRVPLDNAVRNIKKVSEGDLTVDFGKPDKDELGVLTQNMQGLVNNLRTILHDIADSSNQLATTAEETTAISNQSYDSVMKEKEQSHIVMSSIQEMAESVGLVSQSINNTLQAVETAHDEATAGDKLLKQNIDRIGNLAEAIESAATVISKLNEETGNIEAVLEVIRGVAEQTNLLALNAAIEAARAGEQGRGFAVVADEVRTLASRTHDSTEEIQELIARLLDGSKAAVKTMGQSQEETQQCVSGINEVGAMLTSISSSIDQIKDMSQSIASAAEQQTASAHEQTQNVQVIVDLSEVTASSAEENREASQSLATMAEKQRALVGRFTV